MNNNLKKAFSGVSDEKQAAQDAEMMKNVTNRFKGLFGANPSGTEIPQGAQSDLPPNLQPRPSVLGSAPVPNPVGLGNVMEKVNQSDRANQLKQLQDLQDVGAFEDPNSDANQRAARIKAVLGMK